MIVLRWIAVAIAIAAIWDPAVATSHRERPPVDLVSPSDTAVSGDHTRVAAQLQRDLAALGFRVNTGQLPVAQVAIADAPPDRVSRGLPLFAVTTDARAPSVRIARVSTSTDRAPGQSAQLQVLVDGVGVVGETVEVRVEDGGVPVASERHQWRRATESWSTTLDYLPVATARSVRVRAIRVGLEPGGESVQDVRLPAERPPFRILAYGTTVSWPATFVRRSLEGQAAFALSVIDRASPTTATRAGAPPRSLTSVDLTPYDVVIVGSPEDLPPPDVETLRRFVDERGGVIALIPSRKSTGGYTALLGGPTIEARALEQPTTLVVPHGPAIQASEMLVVRLSSTGARALARVGPENEAVVFVLRRGAGGIIFSGALDAWRYRATEQESFARFWRSTLIEAAQAVPPRLKLEVSPGVARPGERIRIRAIVGPDELAPDPSGGVALSVAARVIGPQRHVDEVARLWPTAEPGTFAGEWTANASGDYLVAVSSGSRRADAVLVVDDRIASPAPFDPQGLRIAAVASGGVARPPDRIGDLVAAIASRFPAQQIPVTTHPMRSPWWCVPFAMALCLEWIWRRMHGER